MRWLVNVDVSSLVSRVREELRACCDSALRKSASNNMHDLLKHVLTERDLTRAGDIFAIPDSEIVDDLNEVVRLVEPRLPVH